MYIARKFRIYPTQEQEVALSKSFGVCRWFWNYSLNLCIQTYQSTGKGLSRGAIQGLLPALKKEYPWLKDAYSQCLQYVALNLSTAYKNFFDKRAAFPRFKSKKGRQSISYPQNVKFAGDYIKLPVIGLVYCKQHRELEGTIKTVTISKNPDGRYYASVLVDDGNSAPEPTTEGTAIGVDVGLTHFCVTSSGSKYDNPRHLAKKAKNLKRKQQKLARKQANSRRRDKARRLVARVQSKIARTREDFLHKLSRKIVNENQVIAAENLNILGMVRNHNLAKAISDAGWGMFLTMLKYKAERNGSIYIEVDRFFPSSKTCHVCLNRVDSLPLDVRVWDCLSCGTKAIDRDINAATNIRNEALRILRVRSAEVSSDCKTHSRHSLGTSETANGGSVSRAGKTSVLLDAVPREVGSP